MDFYLTALLQGLCFSALALGIYISMKIFNIPDITTDGSYTLGGVVTAIMLTHHQPVYIVLPAVIVAGGIAGALTGIIHTKLKINALLAGILVMTALYSVNLSLMG
ncbi:MAG: ABC transporter permease, partial [Bacteroidota bacterium]|nr:ABC transporter permease [Bacteroidota bacterium]